MNGTVYHMWSPTCGPCQTMKPFFADLKEEFPQFTWVSVNTHEDKQGFAERFGVKFVPSLVMVVSDSTGKTLMSEKKTSTNPSDYYRLLRSGLRLIQ